MLELENLSVSVDGKNVVQNITFTLEKGKVYALMGPNASGKSSLCNAIMGNPRYKAKGKILFEGKDISSLPADERARLGIFLSFQNPEEVEGVPLSEHLRKIYMKKYSPEEKKDEIKLWAELDKKVADSAKDLSLSTKGRQLNVGFSGGEKKKGEMLQMGLLSPKLMMLDEIDSGLDVDALKAVAEKINAMRFPERAILLVTHYARILKYVRPDHVLIMRNGKIERMDGPELAEEIEEKGYGGAR